MRIKVEMKVEAEIEIPDQLHKEIGELVLSRLKAYHVEQQEKGDGFPKSSSEKLKKKKGKYRCKSLLIAYSPFSRRGCRNQQGVDSDRSNGQ